MAGFTHRTAYTFSGAGSGGAISQSVDTSSEAETNRDVTVPASTTQEVDVDFEFADLKRAVLLADKDCTLKTNSSGAPDDTIALKANDPLEWRSANGYFANPFSADVTSIFIVNGAGAAVRVRMFFLTDPTP